MLARYVLADVVRNPRRTLSTVVGVVLGVGLFCGVLFFVDGLSASMTQRAVDPLAIDMQRIVTGDGGATVSLTQRFEQSEIAPGEQVLVTIDVRNVAEVPAHEVSLRARPEGDVAYVPASATVDGSMLEAVENPFALGPGRVGHNLGTLEPGEGRTATFLVEASATSTLDDTTVRTTFSTRESVSPTPANQPARVSLDDLARQIADLPGVARATPLSIAELGSSTLSARGQTAPGAAKIFGFDAAYVDGDDTIDIVDGAPPGAGATISAEAAAELGLAVGDEIRVTLPDASRLDLEVTGVADLSRARSLFSSRRGGDLETFIYTPLSVVVSPDEFSTVVRPAYERAAATTIERQKSPPIREVDVFVERDLLDADPATAAAQTERIGASVAAVAASQGYVLDNISNTLHVAADDARVAKRLFVFLGVPGAILAAVLAAYAGHVLAEAQRREQATLRIRGASRRHLVRMLAVRTLVLASTASVLGLVAGYVVAATILGASSLERASTASLVTSGLIGTVGGAVATGTALFLTGRRSIDREINEDRAQLSDRPPVWRRIGLDALGLMLVVVGTVWAGRTGAFDGAPGSVYFGRSVELNVSLLVLPVLVWVAGALVAARLAGWGLGRTGPASSGALGSSAPALVRRSIGRRPWAITNAALVVALIVALATSLAVFTASYDAAKADDARYANGADLRLTPGPTAERSYTVEDAPDFEVGSVQHATPVIYGLSNAILRSARTSDPANLVALDPTTYIDVAPLDPATAQQVRVVDDDPETILLSADMAAFLQAEVGDRLNVLLARATPEQAEIEVTVAGLFERLPGFAEGADAVLPIADHTAAVPDKHPDLFLAATSGGSAADLDAAVVQLRAGPASGDSFQIETSVTTLDRDQSSLAALNIAGLVDLDSTFALAMATVAMAIFVFGLLLQRRREYVTLRAQGLAPRTVRLLIAAEAATAAVIGIMAGLLIGAAMGYYFVAVLRPLFVLDPGYTLPVGTLSGPVLLVLVATAVSSLGGSRLVNRLEPSELLRDE